MPPPQRPHRRSAADRRATPFRQRNRHALTRSTSPPFRPKPGRKSGLSRARSNTSHRPGPRHGTKMSRLCNRGSPAGDTIQLQPRHREIQTAARGAVCRLSFAEKQWKACQNSGNSRCREASIYPASYCHCLGKRLAMLLNTATLGVSSKASAAVPQPRWEA